MSEDRFVGFTTPAHRAKKEAEDRLARIERRQVVFESVLRTLMFVLVQITPNKDWHGALLQELDDAHKKEDGEK